jgi:LacI family transcriptional regulator
MAMNQTKVTILDIAEKAQVSPSTVSRVLRNSAAVAEKKRIAVMRAVDELDYQPNIFAQSLASGQSMTVGVLTQNFGSPFYDAILEGILLEMENTDYWPLFADGRWHPDIEQQALDMLTGRRVDGLIIIGGRTSEDKIQKIASKTPVIVVARKLKHDPERCVYLDNFQAAFDATNYLLKRGHRNIAHITAAVVYDETVDDVHQRRLGYEQALRDAGIEPDPRLLVEGTLQQSSGVLAVEMLLSRGRPFSAIFAANDQMAFGARLALYRRHIRVPEEISLIGFDDDVSAAYMVPPLTTVRQPARKMGQMAAGGVLQMIQGGQPKFTPVEGELIPRQSVARLR